MAYKIEIIIGDITQQRVDAIVNAANKSLLGGGGVDGAIHRSAGRELEIECKELENCPTGEARITKSYNLEQLGIGWVIHAVGPRWLGGLMEEERLLENAYEDSLSLAVNYKEVYPKQCLEVLERHTYGLNDKSKENLRQEVLEEAKLYVKEHPIKTVAFPSISTGIYHFPLEKAAEIALNTVSEFLILHNEIQNVTFVCFDKRTFEAYDLSLKKRNL